MKIFRRREKHSSFRFCQSISELPESILSGNDICLKLAKLVIHDSDALKDQQNAEAFGIVDTVPFLNWPVLPVELSFDFSPISSYDFSDSFPIRDQIAGSGGGLVEKYDAPAHFRAHFWIRDPGQVIFKKVKAAFKHSMNTGRGFQDLILRKETYEKRWKRLDGMSGEERVRAYREESDAVKSLRTELEAKKMNPPKIHFTQVLLHDCITLSAPKWAHSIFSVDDFSSPIFKSSVIARYRAAMARTR